jgi:His-Xaa-Ser system protein HxsD
MKQNIKNNVLKLKINSRVYPPEAVYSTCYVFIDRAYLFLDGEPKKEIRVTMKGKKNLSKKQLESMAGEFSNELLSAALRINLARHNKKMRQRIVERALVSAIEEDNLSGATGYAKDPLGIAVPWEEKYGKKSTDKK